MGFIKGEKGAARKATIAALQALAAGAFGVLDSCRLGRRCVDNEDKGRALWTRWSVNRLIKSINQQPPPCRHAATTANPTPDSAVSQVAEGCWDLIWTTEE